MSVPILSRLYDDRVRLRHDDVIPYRGHVTPQTVLNKGNRAMAMLRLHGMPFELIPGGVRRARASVLNTLLRQIADPTLEVCFHMVHRRGATEPPQPISSNPFVRSFMAGYNNTALTDLFNNEWFISAIVDPSASARRKLLDYLPRRRAETLALDHQQHRRLEDVARQIESTLADYAPTRLGIIDVPTDTDPLPFTEIGTALRMIRTAHYEPVPHTWGSLGAAIYDTEVEVEPFHFNTGVGTDPFGAILCFLNYPNPVRTGMLNALMSAPYPLVISHSFRFQTLSVLTAIYSIAIRQMQNFSFGKRVTAAAAEAINEVEANEAAPGRHHFQIAAYGRTLDDLEAAVTDVRTKVSQQGGATIKRERNVWHDGALETQYYAQLPGSQHMKPAPADISSLDLAAMASLDNYPLGQRKGYWGASPLRLRTRAGTAWDLTIHDEDVGHFLCIGPNGRGKTTFGGALTTAIEPIMGATGIRLLIDKDDSNRLWIEAQGGRHKRLRRNEPSGLAPLRAYDDSPRARSFVYSLLRRLIERHGRPLNNTEDKQLMRGIVRQLKMPRDTRSLSGVREFLGFRDGSDGAGDRLERYCKGGSMGWLLDNDEQTVHVGPGLQGYDFGDLLPREGLTDDGSAETAAAVISFELRSLMDGRRIFCLFDECRFYIGVLGALIEDLALTGRKKELVAGLLFQQPEHCTETPIGTALVAQMRRKYVFPDAGYKDHHLRSLGLSDAAIKQVKGDMMAGHARRFLVWDKDPVVCDFDLTGMPELNILSARPANVILFDQLRTARPDAPIGEIVESFHQRFADREVA